MKNQKKIHKITTKLYNVYKLIYKTESCGCKVGQKNNYLFQAFGNITSITMVSIDIIQGV
jgi:hypothetical protein